MQQGGTRGSEARISATGGLAITAAAWLLFGLAHALVRLAFDHSLSPADSLEVIAAQEYRFSYRAAQPPLFTWILWASNQVLGPTQLSLQLVKYAIMLAAGMLFYLASLAATADRALSVVASVATLLLFNVGLSIHDQSTHSIALIAALGGLVYGYALLARAPTLTAYGVIAAAMIAGFLSKHSFGIIALAIPVAFAMDRTLRQRILSWKFAVTLLVVLVALAPFLLWMLEHRADAASRLSKTIYVPATQPLWRVLLLGQARLAGGLAVVLGPLLITLAIVFPTFRKRLVTAHREIVTGSQGDTTAGILRAAWIATLIVAVSVAALAAERVPSRHLLMIALPAALAMVWLVARDGAARRSRLIAVVAVVVASQVILIGTRLGTYAAPGWPFCSSCHHLMPVAALAEKLIQRGYGAATIVVDSDVTGANLMPHMPRARIVLLRLPVAAAPHPKTAAQTAKCVLVRRAKDAAEVVMHPSFRAYRDRIPAATAPNARIRLPRAIDGRRSYSWYVTALDPKNPLCATR
jgi:Dolichyl-phosphate-mannose-protein mannosyltransferase